MDHDGNKPAASHDHLLALWSILFLNTTAGISIISQASPMAQEMTNATAAAAAGMVGLISIANGSGRLLWAWLSDFTGRRNVFLTLFLVQAVVFVALSRIAGETAPLIPRVAH